MRIRAIIVLFLIVLGFSFGCRNALSPNADRNRPPETWITGAPQDTITVKDKNGKVVGQPNPGTIPTRFHIYWAGSDIDGAVTGFYWAVVETLPVAAAGTGTDLPPPLPGPRASQYKFTAKTDSTFDFNVSEFRTDRQHAFFIFAVDDKGRSDPTPARFIFFALDQNPALPIFDVSQSTGGVVRLAAHGVPYRKDTTIVLRDSFEVATSAQPPRDTIPSGARIDFRWHGEPRISGGIATKYKYRLSDNPFFTEVDSSVHSVSYNTGIGGDQVAPGTKVFTLRTIDLAGGADNVTRRFQINYSPDTWFAGPDPRLVPVVNDPTDPIDTGHRYRRINSLTDVPTGRTSLLGCDSLYYWPSERPQRKTFWEWYKDKLFLRAEGDTVDMNSWVILQAGGADRDSPYNIDARPTHRPDTSGCFGEPARVLHPGAPNGSPVGFRYQYAHGLDPRSVLTSVPSQSSLFPVFDAAVPFEQPTVNAYKVFTQSGKVYMTLRAEDGDGATDDRLPDMLGARLLTDDVDSRTNPDTDPVHVSLRRQLMMTFFVNRAPYFDYGHPAFIPKPPEFNNGIVASIDTTRVLTLSLKSIDPDPFDPASRTTAIPGGPSAPEDTVLRTQVTVIGTYTLGGVTRDTSYTNERHFSVRQPYLLDLKAKAPYITGTHLTLIIELCDCSDCEDAPGTGRCITSQPIPVNVVPGGAAPPGRGTMVRPTGTKPLEASGRSSSQ